MSDDVFVLSIDLGNDAMDNGQDVAYALRMVADRLDSHGFECDCEGRVRDVNGNTVGSWEFQ